MTVINYYLDIDHLYNFSYTPISMLENCMNWSITLQEMVDYSEREATTTQLPESAVLTSKGGAWADYLDCGKGVDEILDVSAQQGEPNPKIVKISSTTMLCFFFCVLPIKSHPGQRIRI